MKRQTRNRIFYAFLILFVLIGFVVVIYAEGWRINFSTFQVEKAGGIYVRSYPDDAAITLDGKPAQNKSAFLSRGTFIADLFPKTYNLQLKASGYDAWSEDAIVLPSLVDEMKYAVLVPRDATNVATGTPANVGNFFEADGNVVTWNASGTAILWRNKTIARGTVVSHSTNLQTAIIRSSNANGGAVFSLYDFADNTSTSILPFLRQAGITPTSALNIFIDPYDSTGIIAQTPSKLVAIDAADQKTVTLNAASPGTAIETSIAPSPTVIAWADYSNASNTSRVAVYDKFSGNLIDDSLVTPGRIKQLTWVRGNVLGILEDDNSLFLYDASREQLTKLADDVKQFYPTADGSTIAALEYHSMEVFDENTGDYYRFTLPQAESVQSLMWYKDETHLFVQYSDRVAFLDLADADLKNVTTISDGRDPAYDAQENSLYLIDSGQKLLRYDFPQ